MEFILDNVSVTVGNRQKVITKAYPVHRQYKLMTFGVNVWHKSKHNITNELGQIDVKSQLLKLWLQTQEWSHDVSHANSHLRDDWTVCCKCNLVWMFLCFLMLNYLTDDAEYCTFVGYYKTHILLKGHNSAKIIQP